MLRKVSIVPYSEYVKSDNSDCGIFYALHKNCTLHLCKVHKKGVVIKMDNLDDLLMGYPRSKVSNLKNAEFIVTKAIAENIPNGFKNAADEQIKKLLVNIILNFATEQTVDGGTL